MNTKVMVMSLKNLQQRVETARSARTTAAKQVADAKQTFHAVPDDFNKALLSRAESEYGEAVVGERKANEAVRIFCFKQRGNLNAKGKQVRV